MRIVAGKYRAKKLTPPSHNIRPTLDKVKQALFTRLQFVIEDACVLDLFSGSGALGIEAISRGAKKVVFCDNDDKSIALTKKNISELKNNLADYTITNCNYLNYLKNTQEQFDLILIDPPYKSQFYVPALEIIKQKKLLKPNGVIVCERLRTEPIIQNFFNNTATKNYGTVSLDYLKNF